MKKKLLFIIWSFTAGGGAERILANIVNNLDDSKYEISILEFSNFNIRKEEVKDNINILKPIIKVSSNNNRLFKMFEKIKNKFVYMVIRVWPSIARKVFIKEDYDVEIAFNYGIPSYLVSRKKKRKKICWVHSSIEDLDINLCGKKVTKNNKRQLQAFKRMDNIVAISNRTQKSIQDIYPEVSDRIVKIYNGYDFNSILKKSEDKTIGQLIESEKFILIAIGRLVKQKNFSLLIEVANELKKANIDYVLYIIGEGEQRGILEEKINSYKLNDNVKLIGYLNNPYPYLKKANLFCLTSEAEGFPTVLVESMIIGCPFISTNVAGADELSMNGECGIISDYNPSNISKLIIDLLMNEEKILKMSKYSKEKAIKYSLDIQMKSIEELLDYR